MEQRSFVNTRARFQRLTDAKFFAGWVKDLSSTDVLIRIPRPIPVKSGEQFLFQIHGNQASAMFKAVLAISGAEELCFNIPEPIRFLAANEEMRVMVEGINGKITSEEGTFEVTVVDVSQKGAGLLTKFPLTRGAEVQLTMDSPQGDVTCTGEIRYCKPDELMPDHFRAGLLVHSCSRIDQARWNRLLIKEAA